MPFRRAGAILVSLGCAGTAALAAACFTSSTTSELTEAGDDATPALDSGTQVDAMPGLDATVDAPPGSGEAEAGPGDSGDEGDAVPDAGSEAPAMAETGADAESGADAPSVDAPAEAGDGSPPDATDGSIGSISALRFDGVSDWVHLPAASGGASESAFSVELWFRSTSNTGNMFEVYNSGGSADRFLSLNAGQVCFYVYGTYITQVCTTAATYGDSAWHHAAGTLGAGGTILYVDGVHAASNTATTGSAFSTDTDFRLGMGHSAFVSGIIYFQGDLDEVRVWSVERSAAEIAASYRAGVDPATAGLQGYWRLDESGAAAVTVDATSGGHDGQLMNFTFTPSPWISPGAF